jgi:hypothetical protein
MATFLGMAYLADHDQTDAERGQIGGYDRTHIAQGVTMAHGMPFAPYSWKVQKNGVGDPFGVG